MMFKGINEECRGPRIPLLMSCLQDIRDADLMVVAGDMLFSEGFDVSGVQRFFREKGGDVAVYYELAASESSSSRGIVEVGCGA